MIHLIVFLPLAGFLIAGLFGKQIGDKASEYVTSGFLVIAAILSWVNFIRFWLGGAELQIIEVCRWMQLAISCGLGVSRRHADGRHADRGQHVSALVHIYSIGYMHHDPHRPRFFAYLSLFTFAMLMLVTSDNLIQMFFRLGRRRPCLLSADRLLVQETVRQCCSHQGLCRQPGWRFRLRARHISACSCCSTVVNLEVIFANAAGLWR